MIENVDGRWRLLGNVVMRTSEPRHNDPTSRSPQTLIEYNQRENENETHILTYFQCNDMDWCRRHSEYRLLGKQKSVIFQQKICKIWSNLLSYMYILHSQFILSLGPVSFGKAANNTQGTLIFPPVTRCGQGTMESGKFSSLVARHKLGVFLSSVLS